MNITRVNFKESLGLIRSVIDKCHYFALDFEMSGTQASDRVRNSQLDGVLFV